MVLISYSGCPNLKWQCKFGTKECLITLTLIPIKKPISGIKIYRQNKNWKEKKSAFLSFIKQCRKFIPEYVQIFTNKNQKWTVWFPIILCPPCQHPAAALPQALGCQRQSFRCLTARQPTEGGRVNTRRSTPVSPSSVKRLPPGNSSPALCSGYILYISMEQRSSVLFLFWQRRGCFVVVCGLQIYIYIQRNTCGWNVWWCSLNI